MTWSTDKLGSFEIVNGRKCYHGHIVFARNHNWDEFFGDQIVLLCESCGSVWFPEEKHGCERVQQRNGEIAAAAGRQT